MAVSRRAALLGGVGLGLAAFTTAPPAPPPKPTGTTTATTTSTVRRGAPLVVDVQRVSAARGRPVRVLAVFPGEHAERLPVFLALHGRGSDAGMFLDLGVPALLAAAVADGVAPFAVLAVDGGDTYWVAGRDGDDPQRMLTDEVPGWLDELGLDRSPAGALGISMGGYGALNYARSGPGRPATAVLSPALFRTWPDAQARHVFADQAHWQRTNPLTHLDELPGPLGVWCGTGDPFLPVARELIAATHPAGRISAGAHDSGYWHGVLPEALRFLGGVLR